MLHAVGVIGALGALRAVEQLLEPSVGHPERLTPERAVVETGGSPVGARIPKPNPDHDPDVYKQAKEYEKRVMWGPFEGRRPLEEDEK